MADKSKNNSKFKSSSILDDISALHNINKPKNSRATGSEYETLAAAFLEQNGHTIITRNYRTRYGEIDIIIQRLCLQNVNTEVLQNSATRWRLLIFTNSKRYVIQLWISV